jgi:phosphatidylinositol alpha-1,6-mannosyltransferase
MRSGKVLLITSNLPPVLGGSGVVYENLARYSNGRILVISAKRSYRDRLPLIGWREHDRVVPYRVVRLPLIRPVLLSHRPGRLIKIKQTLAELVIRARLVGCLLRLCITESPSPRAICIGELLANGWLIGLLHRLGINRTLVYVHGEEITTDDPYDREHRRARRALLSADKIVVVSRFSLKAVHELIGFVGSDRICLIENGVDNNRFKPTAKRPDLIEAYGLEKSFVFISVCRLLEKKGIDRAIEAFAEVARLDPSCRYLIVGTGPYQGILQDLACQVGMADKIIFAGEVADDDLVSHYALGDVFVMPNRTLADGDTEGFGLVFLEANACGLPVVAGRDGGSVDAVQNEYNGLASAMLRLRNDEQLRKRLGRGGRERAAGADWIEKTKDFLRAASE